MASKASISSSGITTNDVTGERHIPASTRPDGTQRRQIRVRPGYLPPEDVQVYKNRAAAAFKSGAKAGIPGAESLVDNDPSKSAASSKNAKKREAKRRAKTANDDEAGAAETEATPRRGDGGVMDKENWRAGGKDGGSATAAAQDDPEAEKEKKARNLKKKLRQARDLREKKDKGESLLPEQLEKMIKVNELVRELDSLGFDSEGEKKAEDSTAKTGQDEV